MRDLAMRTALGVMCNSAATSAMRRLSSWIGLYACSDGWTIGTRESMPSQQTAAMT